MKHASSAPAVLAAARAAAAVVLLVSLAVGVTAFTPIILTPLDHNAPSATMNHVNVMNHHFKQRQYSRYPPTHASPRRANYMNYNDNNSYYYGGGGGGSSMNGDYRDNANNNNLFYGASSYNQRSNDGYAGGVNLSTNGRSQQDNLRRRSNSVRNDDYMYDDYYRNSNNNGYSGYGGGNGGGGYFYRGPDRNGRASSYNNGYDNSVGGDYARQYNGDRSGGLMRYRPNEDYDSSSSFYNLEGKRVRRFDPYYDRPDRFYDQGALYDRERAMAEGRRGREYPTGGLRRYDPYYDGANGLYDEAALYEGKSAGLRQYSFDPYYDEDRFSSSFGGGDGVRSRRPMSMTTPYGSGGSALALTGGRRRGGMGGRGGGEYNDNVIGSGLYDRRPMHEKYYPPSSEREERNRTRPGAMQSRRRAYDDDGRYGDRESNRYYDDDRNGYGGGRSGGSGYYPFIKNIDDKMENFREGRGVRKSTYYNDNDDFRGSYGGGGSSYVSGAGRGGMSGKPITSNDDRYNYVSRGRSVVNGGGMGRNNEYEYAGMGRRGGTINGSYYPPPVGNPRGPANGGMSIGDLKDML